MRVILRLLGLSKLSKTRAVAEALVKPAYEIFTRKFDRIVDAKNLRSAIGHLTDKDELETNKAFHQLRFGISAWKTKNLLEAAEASYATTNILRKDIRDQIFITLLLDQSGSMRGMKMIYLAAAMEIISDYFISLGIKFEILGFTTRRWLGGKSKEIWRLDGKPRNPGRLNDLLHIIYKDGYDKKPVLGEDEIKAMLRPDLPKENIDGEALEWAASRVLEHRKRHSYLVMLSDGAPVDDATLSSNNNPAYLENHLLSVIETIQTNQKVNLLGFGIGYNVNRCYKNSHYVEHPQDIAAALISFLGENIAKLSTGDKVNNHD